MSAKKKAKLCQWCKKKPATKKMNVVEGRFDVQRKHLCDTCARKASKENFQWSGW